MRYEATRQRRIRFLWSTAIVGTSGKPPVKRSQAEPDRECGALA
jgi:hypothetical protein